MFVSYSQMDFPEFGSFSDEEKKLKRCSFDPEAEAALKEFYKKMVDMLNEPIVLKLPN